MIRVVNLKKEFVMGEVHVHALRGVSFEIQDGEFIAIMGKSGSGKSTLLRQLGLIDEPTEGEIYYDDKGTHELSEKERSHFRLTYLGYIFQEFALIPELTAMENVMLPAMMQGAQKEEYESRAKKLLETFAKLNKEMHQTIVLVTHDQEDEKYIDRTIWVKDGQLTHKHGKK